MFALDEEDFKDKNDTEDQPKLEDTAVPSYGTSEYSVDEQAAQEEAAEEPDLKWYQKFGNYLKDRYEHVQDFIGTVGETMFGDVRGLTGNVGAGIGAYAGSHFGPGGLVIGLGIGALTGAYVGKFLKKDLGGTEFDIVCNNLNKQDHADVTGTLTKLRSTLNSKEGNWETRLDVLKETMSNLYANIDGEVGGMDESTGKSLILDVSTALNYLEKGYLGFKAESTDVLLAERAKSYSFEENVDTFKELYADVGERPPSALLSTIDVINDSGYTGIGQNVGDLSTVLYQGKKESTYHRWRTRVDYLKGGMDGLRKHMDAAIDDIEGHEKEVKKLYLDVSTSLNVMSKTYLDKRDMAAVRYAERSTGYNFEADAKEFRDTYGEKVADLGLEL